MQTSLHVRNVQEAYVRGLAIVREHGILEETRNGPALVVPWPVLTVYEKPIERVLLDPRRDANPFFHALESLWMLAGRNDVPSIGEFLGALKKYSDDGHTYHGAYGYRWRRHFMTDKSGGHWPEHGEGPDEIDQLRTIIEMLRKNPADRRIVLQMWDPDTDLDKDGKDFPCNTSCMFRARSIERPPSQWTPELLQLAKDRDLSSLCLDMTITNRSNDAVWGAYGANAVHFSVLQEFVAAAAGLEVGRMYQFSNNLHGYVESMDKVGDACWPITYGEQHREYSYVRSVPLHDNITGEVDLYKARRVKPIPLFRKDATTDLDHVFKQIGAFWDDKYDGDKIATATDQFTDEGLNALTAIRAAHAAFKLKNFDQAFDHLIELNQESDWYIACSEWLTRRFK